MVHCTPKVECGSPAMQKDYILSLVTQGEEGADRHFFFFYQGNSYIQSMFSFLSLTFIGY